MKKVLFSELSEQQKDIAVSQMFTIKKERNYPYGSIWKKEDDIRTGLRIGYKPDGYLSFYIDVDGKLETKMEKYVL